MSTNSRHAKTYFQDALSKSDYYMDDQELQGRFFGRLSERLGIAGPASKEAFFAMCENRFPGTDKPLTIRTKEKRTTGYDINFHAPKALSVLHSLSNDDHLLRAFETAVQETMQDIEQDSQVRVRKGGKSHDRHSGELVYARFTHQTARPVDGSLPDPHLHAHCYVFNCAWDPEEQRIKAGQFRDINRDMPYYQARFHKRLADQLIELGYQVRRTEKSFEVEGVPKKVIKHFSKRTDEIGRFAMEKGIHDPKKLASLGARTRAKKQKGLTMTQLKKKWKQQILEIGEEEKGSQAVRFASAKQPEKTDPKRVLDHALKHCFERASVMQDRRILEVAYRHALGNPTVALEAITEAFAKDDRIIRIKQGEKSICTTKEVLAEEKRMVELARNGKNKHLPLYFIPPVINLKDEQSRAALHVLTTTHKVSIIRGAAGTGKTTMMKETIRLIEKAGKKVTVVAPTAQASRGVLKEEGFEKASTVANLLTDQKMQKELKGGVLWVDEAGLLGTGDMKALLEVATKQNSRLILAGDTRQHASVVRGDALRILNTIGDIRCAEINKIRRQKNVRYRAAVEDLSKGNIVDGFQKLDDLDAIKTVDPLQPNKELVRDYVEAIKKGKDALIISPTHKQGEEVTNEVRQQLRKEGLIGRKEVEALKLTNLNLTEAEKGDLRNFKEGQIVQFNQNLKGIKRGSLWKVKTITEKNVEILGRGGKVNKLPLSRPNHYDVFEKSEIGLSKGDKIQITRNGFDANRKRLNNGQTLLIHSISKKGEILAKSPSENSTFKLETNFGHLSHAHCITSYAAQGKTVDEVFIAQPAATFGATDARQFYVSVSRGRERARIYTDDKAALLEYASELGDRQSALELVSKKPLHQEYVYQHQRTNYSRQIDQMKTKDDKVTHKIKERDYEPRV